MPGQSSHCVWLTAQLNCKSKLKHNPQNLHALKVMKVMAKSSANVKLWFWFWAFPLVSVLTVHYLLTGKIRSLYVTCFSSTNISPTQVRALIFRQSSQNLPFDATLLEVKHMSHINSISTHKSKQNSYEYTVL